MAEALACLQAGQFLALLYTGEARYSSDTESLRDENEALRWALKKGVHFCKLFATELLMEGEFREKMLERRQ